MYTICTMYFQKVKTGGGFTWCLSSGFLREEMFVRNSSCRYEFPRWWSMWLRKHLNWLPWGVVVLDGFLIVAVSVGGVMLCTGWGFGFRLGWRGWRSFLLGGIWPLLSADTPAAHRALIEELLIKTCRSNRSLPDCLRLLCGIQVTHCLLLGNVANRAYQSYFVPPSLFLEFWNWRLVLCSWSENLIWRISCGIL